MYAAGTVFPTSIWKFSLIIVLATGSVLCQSGETMHSPAILSVLSSAVQGFVASRVHPGRICRRCPFSLALFDPDEDLAPEPMLLCNYSRSYSALGCFRGTP